MDVLIPFAKEIATGNEVTAAEVPRGNACGCECLFCGVPMQVRYRGDLKFFAHQPREVDDETLCEASFARCLFWMARKLLSERSQIRLPEYRLTLSDSNSGLRETYSITHEQTVSYEQVTFPEPQLSPHWDTADLSIKAHTLRMLLCFGEAAPPGSADNTLSTLSVNISPLETVFRQGRLGFKDAMEEALLQSVENKNWIYHPRKRRAECEFKERVTAACPRVKYRKVPITASATTFGGEDVAGVDKKDSITAATAQRSRAIDTSDPAIRLQCYWRKLEKGLLVHVPSQNSGGRITALHRLDSGFRHRGVDIHAVCTKHNSRFNLHLNQEALTDLPASVFDLLSELRVPTLIICFGNEEVPFECTWVNRELDERLP